MFSNTAATIVRRSTLLSATASRARHVSGPSVGLCLVIAHPAEEKFHQQIPYSNLTNALFLQPKEEVGTVVVRNEGHRYRYFSTSSAPDSSLTPSSSIATTTTSNVVATSSDGIVGEPIDFDTAATIEGNESQIVTIELTAGQVLRAESGALMYMTDGIEMETSTGGGGFTRAFSRMMTGQNLFITDYRYTKNDGKSGKVALGTNFPSKILRLSISQYGGKLVCQKGALLCASHNVDIQMEYSKNITTGFFGGEGFILQGLTGDGEVFLKAGGALIRRELKDGEQLRISSGCLVAFSNGVDYDVQMVKGFLNMFAGGEGIFMTTLTGPGVVWLQGQPPDRMIEQIARRVPSGGVGLAVPVGGSGGGSSSSSSSS